MLSTLLSGEIFAFLLVFARMSAVLMLVPALGEQAIPTNIKLGLALAITLLVYLTLGASLPVMPASPLDLLVLIAGEVLIGVFIGAAARLIMTGLHTGGSIIAFQSGMALAQAFDQTQGAQGAIMANFFLMIGVVLIFTTNLHLLVLSALIESYRLFPPGQLPPAGDFATVASQSVAASFALGVHIAAPFILYGMLFYSGVGILGRLMPQVQVFFIAMPLQIMMAFFILTLVLSASMLWFTSFFEDRMGAFLP